MFMRTLFWLLTLSFLLPQSIYAVGADELKQAFELCKRSMSATNFEKGDALRRLLVAFHSSEPEAQQPARGTVAVWMAQTAREEAVVRYVLKDGEAEVHDYFIGTLRYLQYRNADGQDVFWLLSIWEKWLSHSSGFKGVAGSEFLPLYLEAVLRLPEVENHAWFWGAGPGNRIDGPELPDYQQRQVALYILQLSLNPHLLTLRSPQEVDRHFIPYLLGVFRNRRNVDSRALAILVRALENTRDSFVLGQIKYILQNNINSDRGEVVEALRFVYRRLNSFWRRSNYSVIAQQTRAACHDTLLRAGGIADLHPRKPLELQ